MPLAEATPSIRAGRPIARFPILHPSLSHPPHALRRPAARFVGFVFAACVVVGVGASPAAQAAGRFGDSTWVAPTAPLETAPPAGEPRVAPRDHERAWETVLRTPFRVAFLPLRAVGRGLEAVTSWAGPRYLDPKPPHVAPVGPHLVPAITVGGLSDVGIGPAFTWPGFPAQDDKLSINATLSTVDRRRARLVETLGEPRPVSFRLRADYDLKSDHRFYGIGNAAPKADVSYFLLETASAEGDLILGPSPHRQVRVQGGFSGLSTRRGYLAHPVLEDVFPAGTVPFDGRATRELWYGLAGGLAALDEARDPSRGLDGRFDVRRQVGVRGRDPSYVQWRVEGRAFVPVFAPRRVIALRGVFAGVDPTGGNAEAMPFYRLVGNEGETPFAAYQSERFRDRQLLLGRVEYRWMILYRVSAVALYELGEVAPRTGAFTLRDAHLSYGGGLRLGLSDRSTLRAELAKGSEGMRFALELGSDF